MAPPPSTPPYQHFGPFAVHAVDCRAPLKPSAKVMFCTTICGSGWLTQSSVDQVPAQVSENRMRRLPPPLRVIRPPPSSTSRGRVLGTDAVWLITMVSGRGPQLKVMTPPAATSRTTAAAVQLA